jgi:hypothetical protein
MAPSRLHLLLADPDSGPVLADGLLADAALNAPKPKRAPRGDDVPLRFNPRTDRDDLAAQRWGIVAPEGDQGDRMLAAIAPLRRLREHEQGAPARVYRAAAGMDMAASVSWKDRFYYDEAVPEHERPGYLLLLGDLPELSLDLQHALANGALVGRLAFSRADGAPDLAAYEAYATKVVTFAGRGAAGEPPELRLFTAKDGSAATTLGHEQLVRPCGDDAERLRLGGQLAISAVRRLTVAADLMSAAAEERPSVLLSMSHGLGISTSPEKRRAFQGALQLSASEVLDARRLRSGRFLPGGAWFCVACFGAGTPAASAYHPWLARLIEADPDFGAVDRVLRCLPGPGERPFVAAMPQAALANPEGPLAVIAHVDLAWCYSFSSGESFTESRRARIFSTLKVLVNGGRAGVALDALMHFYRETNDALAASYQDSQEARALGRPDRTDPVQLSHRWMLRNDLRGYILLGDPAARLSLGAAVQVPPPPPAAGPAVESMAGPAVETPPSPEPAVLALLGGEETPRAIAERHGVTLAELWARLAAHWATQGGRR